MENLRALVFDLDNTLYPSSECNAEDLCNKRIKRYFINKLKCRTDEFAELRRQLIEECGDLLNGINEKYGFDRQEYWEYIWDIEVSSITPNPELNQLLKKIKPVKYIHTDSSRKHVEKTLKSLEIDGNFAGIFTSGTLGFIFKNTTETYEKLLNKIRLKAEEILLFDNNPKNIAAAQALKIKAVAVGSKQTTAEYQFSTINDALKNLFNL